MADPQPLKNRLTSRKFLLTILAVLIPLMNRTLNIGLYTDEIVQIQLLFAAYIGVEGIRDCIVAKNDSE